MSLLWDNIRTLVMRSVVDGSQTYPFDEVRAIKLFVGGTAYATVRYVLGMTSKA